MRIRILQLKKTAFAALIVLLLSVVGVTKAFAQTFTVGNLNYSVNDDGVSVTVTGHVDGQNATGELVIPESVEYDGNSFVVSLIGENAFSECAGITSLTIGNSITEIRDRAFYNCDGLEGSLSIGNSVVLLYFSVFADCDNITSITIPSSVLYIAPVAFYGCDNLNSVYFNATNCYPFAEGGWGGMSGNWIANCPSLTNIIIGEGVVNIPAYFASNCTTLTGSLTIPNSVVTIGEKAFYNCSGFTGSLTIPNSVTNIESNAFYGCTGLSDNLTLGQSLTSIGNSAFYNACENLSTFTILAETPPSLGTLVFTSVDYAIPVQVPCGSLDAYQNSDGWNAFANIQEINPCWWNITALAAPAQGGSISGAGTYEQGTTCTLTATAYGDYEFSHWTENGVTVSTNATYSFVVEGNRSLVARFTNPNFIAFADPNVKAICVSNWDTDGDGELSYAEAAAVTNLGRAFQSMGITSFNELQYFSGLTFLNEDEFNSCSNLTSITIPESVTTIGYNAFAYCNLTSITIPESVTNINCCVFYGSGITTINYNATNCSVNDWLNGVSLTNLNIGDNVQVIPDNFVSNQSNLVGTLHIPASVTSIGGSAFANCRGFTGTLTIPASVTSIGGSAFSGCTGFSNLTIGSSVTTIGESAFYNCSGLTGSLTLPENLTSIGSAAFANCSGFIGDLTIPNSVTAIGEYAFGDCTGFVGALTIGTAVASIGPNAFQNCTGLTGVIFDATNCTSMGNYYNNEYDFNYNYSNGEYYTDDPYCYFTSAFSGCSNITSLQIGEGVQTIPNGAFRDLTGITGSFNIPNSVVTIGDYAFAETNLGGVLTIPENVSSVGIKAFAHTGVTTINFNATNCTKLGYFYRLNGGYNELAYISAFFGCSEIESLQIGDNVLQIPAGAFKDLQGISGTCNLPCSLETIGDYAFDNIGNTGTLIIPSSVTSIGSYAFFNNEINTLIFNATNCTYMGSGYDWNTNTDYSTFNSITTLIIGDQVENIPAYAFMNCATVIGDLSLPNSLISIGESAFEGCSGFSGNLVIPNAVETIGNNAFKDCTGLGGTLTIGENATTIHGTAFTNTNFSTMNYNATNCIIGGLVWDQWYNNQYFANNSFSGMPLLETLNIGINVESISQMAFKDCTTLTGTLILPNSLKSIGDQAFYNCYGFEGIAMGNAVETIGSEAFRNCGGLRGELILPESMLSVGNYAFASCDELTSINYNAINCTAMGNAQQPVFYDCASMAHIKIGENVESIPNYAFKRCSTVTDMTVAATVPPTVGSSTFGTLQRSIPVTVQCGTTAAYQAAQYWNEFTNYNEGFNYMLEVTCNPERGTVVVNKMADCDDPTVRVTAYPEMGYAFLGWSENGTLVSEVNPYTFNMESSRELQAEFIQGVSYSVTVTVVPATAGTVTGQGNYNDGSAVTLNATSNSGYAFVNWTENGSVVSTDEEYTFTIHANRNLVANFTPYAYHWDVNIHQYPGNMTAIGVIQIDGVEQATPTLEIGAFCNDECRGRQLLTYYPQVDRYMVFLMLYGEDGDEMSFKLFDHVLEQELTLSCTSLVTFAANTALGNPVNPYVFNFINSQQTPLAEGWTWYSTYIEQDDIEGLQMMTEALNESGVMIKSQTGFIANSGGQWMGNLNEITNESMYMVNTTAATLLDMAGNSTIASQHPITMDPGWNWIGYPMTTANGVSVALSDIEAQPNDVLKSQESFATYYEGFGWFGSLNTITPGMGLMYDLKNSSPVTFTYTEGRSGELKRNVTAESNHWVPDMHKYTNNMNVMSVVELDDVELRDGHYELAVFAGNECRGSVRLVYVEPIDRYVAFLTVAGREATDLQFVLFDADENKEYGNAKESLVFESDAVVGNTKSMMTVHFTSRDQESDWSKIAVYPNPADGGEHFSIVLPAASDHKVQVEIINELGAVVAAAQSSSLPLEMKAPATPGLYTLKIVAEGNAVCFRKLVVK